ncbi:MAG TPA: competence/damage-inducible protein A [Polyangiaceae bacterium]|nr:competence/damage-inducible protein A [Polyangiaceae bacterium]
MTAAILSIGTELTRGEIVNTNATWLSSELTALGFEVREAATVDDHAGRIGAALKRLAEDNTVIVATGGLGPTTDDLTAASVAGALGVPLVRDEASIEAIRRRFEAARRTMSATNEKQADFPRGSTVLPNPVGTAPGFAVEIGESRAFFMPGVPREMKRIFTDHVVAKIAKRAEKLTFQTRLKTFGLAESIVGERLADIEARFPGITLGYRAHFPEIEVKVHATAQSHDEARVLSETAAAEVRARLADVLYGEGDDTFSESTGRALRSRGFRLAVAESCTGGLLAHLITSEPGASDYFVADAVTYANSAKTRLLGVSEDVLRGHGAVSAEVAAAMAEGVRRLCSVEIAVAITGIAGPSGASPNKPVGLVFWAVSHPGGTIVRDRIFNGDRGQIQMLASYAALALLREVCLGRAT